MNPHGFDWVSYNVLPFVCASNKAKSWVATLSNRANLQVGSPLSPSSTPTMPAIVKKRTKPFVFVSDEIAQTEHGIETFKCPCSRQFSQARA